MKQIGSKGYEARKQMIKSGRYISLSEYVGNRSGKKRAHKRGKYLRKLKWIYYHYCRWKGVNVECWRCHRGIEIRNIFTGGELTCNMRVILMCGIHSEVNFIKGDVVWICEDCHNELNLHLLCHADKVIAIQRLQMNPDFVSSDDLSKNACVVGSFAQKSSKYRKR